jgi:hypothetical protein
MNNKIKKKETTKDYLNEKKEQIGERKKRESC